MILSVTPSAGAGGPLGAGPLWLALVAMLAYALAALPPRQSARWPRLATPALVLGWALHALLLGLDIGGWGQAQPGLRLGFGPVLSLTAWLVLAVHGVESRLLPLPGVRRVLAAAGLLAVALAWAFPGELRPAVRALAPLHWLLGVASYALFGAAVLHASLLDAADRRLRLARTGTLAPAAAAVPPAACAGGGAWSLGLPLLRLERLTFRFVAYGFAVLSAALLLGVYSALHGGGSWRWDHKTVFSLLAWAVFAALLAGRRWRGWRGRHATRWLYAGTALLLLAYAGTRFVFEVLLARPLPA